MNKINTDNTTIAAYKVFETLKFLIRQPASVTDIIKYLESLKIGNGKPYSKGVIYKYIATLKFAGIKIERKKCKYEVKSIPFKIPFDDEDLKAILILKKIMEQFPEITIKDTVKEFLYILQSRCMPDKEQIMDLENNLEPIKLNTPNETQYKIIEKYEKYCKDNQKLKIEYYNIYEDKIKANCRPLEVKFENNQVYFYCYSELLNEFIELNSKQIIKITQLPTLCTNIRYDSLASTTIYELSGKLTKRYKARNNETCQQTEDKMIVMNKKEAKNLLHSRLLRYGIYCKIKSPKKERSEMQEMIAKTLSNYNVKV